MMKTGIRTSCAVAALVMSPCLAAAQGYNLYGDTGLIDLPSAESQADGQLGFSFSQFGDNRRTAVTFQALPWLSGTVRFSDTPGLPDRSDRSLDLKFRLSEEQGWRPAIALGLRDVLGEGTYGAEYLVATKTVLPGLKLTGGLGWGRLAGEGSFSNPFGGDDRPAPETPDGQIQDRTFFRGDAALFGGVEWTTPLEGLTLTAEYAPDSYEPEVAGGFERKSSFNFGASYAPFDSVRLSAQYLYGSTVGVQLTFTGNPNQPLAAQDLGAGPLPLRARPPGVARPTDWADSAEVRDAVVDALNDAFAAEGISIEQARISGREVDLYLDNSRIIRAPKAIGRVARILALSMPPSVEVFNITLVSDGLAVSTATIRRSDLEAQVDRPNAGEASWRTTQISDALPLLTGPDAWMRPIGPRFSWSFSPTIPANLLDPDGVRLDVLLRASATARLTRNFSLNAQVSRFLIGEDPITQSTSTSTLPRVRSDEDLYFSGRDIELDRLTADYVFKLSPAIYARLSGGYFERTFAGVSGEVLWAPVSSPFALGAEVNYARQREFDTAFGLRDYEVVTGHASVYWDTGFSGLEAQVDVGRYLAGDWGATLGVSRRFTNGWDVSAYVTRTEVSVDEFGDGSYAKGLSVTMPLRWGVPFETRSTASLSLISDVGDGGARLQVPERLYPKVRDYDGLSLNENWGSFWQ